MGQSHILFFVLTLTIGCFFVESVGATVHVVGDSLEWTIPPNATFYEEWTNSKAFVVGDKLVFSYRTGIHNVVEVPKEDYAKCTQDEKAIDMQFQGPTTVTLNTVGIHYYYCGIGTHCARGQKLAVEVSDGKGLASKSTTSTVIAVAPVAPKSTTSTVIPAAPVAPEIKSNGSTRGVGRLVVIIGIIMVAAFLLPLA